MGQILSPKMPVSKSSWWDCCCCLVAELCYLFSDSMDCSLPGSSVHGILWKRILKRVAISFIREPSQSRDWTHISCIGRWILYHWAIRETLMMGLSDMEQQTGSKSGKEYIKAVYCHPMYLAYMQSKSWEMLGWMKHKLESRLPGEISVTSDMQMIPALQQKVKRN